MTHRRIILGIFIQLYLASTTSGWLFSSWGGSNCYRRPVNVGCFPITGHFTNSMGFAPMSPQEMDIGFKILHRTSGRLIIPLGRTRQMLRNRFNPEAKTVIIIHGFLENSNREWIRDMATKLRRLPGPMNVFAVDWRNGANNLNYFQAIANARMAGALTSLFLQDLIELGATPSSFHLIGFSLGAHVAGYVGKRLRGIARITGLDPAGPGFQGTHRDVRLDSSDADVVDILHSDDELGTTLPCGTVDFYPNGGSSQPACRSGPMEALSSLVANIARTDFSRRSMTRAFSCSHMRATQLFAASIANRCSYTLRRCHTVRGMSHNHGPLCQHGDGCPSFGYHMNSTTAILRPGIYRFSTTGSYPFC